MDQSEPLTEEPTAVDQAGLDARMQFLQTQMGNLHLQIRALTVQLTLAAGNGELSSDFKQWTYKQLLQAAAVLEERE